MPVFPPETLTATTGPIAGRAYNGAVDAIRLDNELVRVTGRTTGVSFLLDFWDGTAWRAKSIVVWRGGLGLVWNKASILENRPEVVVVQYEASVAAGGRATVDVTLRRGMRTVLFYAATNAVVNFAVSPLATGEAMTKTAEREVSNVADANGHKLVMGAPRTWNQTPATGLMTNGASKTMAFYVGLQLSGFVSGDAALDLSMQSCGWLSESVRPSRR